MERFLRLFHKTINLSSTSDIETLRQLGETVLELYSGYYLRIYHNISEDDPVHQKLCGLFCFNDHIDVCDVRKIGNQFL